MATARQDIAHNFRVMRSIRDAAIDTFAKEVPAVALRDTVRHAPEKEGLLRKSHRVTVNIRGPKATIRVIAGGKRHGVTYADLLHQYDPWMSRTLEDDFGKWMAMVGKAVDDAIRKASKGV